MAARRMVTLLSDFGEMDGYVAAMKGVIASLAPDAEIVDGSHWIPPQDVQAASWVLGQYWSVYPEGTIHVAVVDPDVGTDRAVLLMQAGGHSFLVPDNGLIAWVMEQVGGGTCYRLRPETHRPGEVSATFHGRDIFAYAAGMLAAGVRPSELGDPVTRILMPPWTKVEVLPDRVVGQIVHVDRFGNLVTNLFRKYFQGAGWGSFVVQSGPFANIALRRTYADVPKGEILCLFGSAGSLEISVSGGSAAQQSPLVRGMAVTVRKSP